VELRAHTPQAQSSRRRVRVNRRHPMPAVPDRRRTSRPRRPRPPRFIPLRARHPAPRTGPHHTL